MRWIRQRIRRRRKQKAAALAAVLAKGGRHYGYETSQESGVGPGTMYPLLQQYLDEGWLVDGWAEESGRRFYVSTTLGRKHLNRIAEASDG